MSNHEWVGVEGPIETYCHKCKLKLRDLTDPSYQVCIMAESHPSEEIVKTIPKVGDTWKDKFNEDLVTVIEIDNGTVIYSDKLLPCMVRASTPYFIVKFDKVRQSEIKNEDAVFKNIVNPIHNPDVPEDIQDLWLRTKSFIRGN